MRRDVKNHHAFLYNFETQPSDEQRDDFPELVQKELGLLKAKAFARDELLAVNVRKSFDNASTALKWALVAGANPDVQFYGRAKDPSAAWLWPLRWSANFSLERGEQ